MAKYQVLERSFINNTIVEEGAIVEYEGKPGKNLKLVEDEPAPKRKAAKTAEEVSEDAN